MKCLRAIDGQNEGDEEDTGMMGPAWCAIVCGNAWPKMAGWARMAGLALLAPSAAFARGNFDPTQEFKQDDWIPIHLGPLDLSITKAVAYLMLGTVLTIALGLPDPCAAPPDP